MATTTTTNLPFRSSGGGVPAAVAIPSPPPNDSLTRFGLFLICALSVGILIVAIVNLRMGNGRNGKATEELSPGDTESDDYPNKTRDYIILIASLLTIMVSIPSIFTTYPKRADR